METKHDAGFSLLELLIALSIFSIGLLALGLIEIHSIRTASRALRLTEASALASSLIEEIQSRSYGTYQDLQETGDFAGEDGLDAFPPESNAFDGSATHDGFTTYWNVADDLPTDGNKTIRVQVHWTDRHGPHQIEFDVLKTEVM